MPWSAPGATCPRCVTPSAFDAWLHRLLVRSCSDQLRRHRHELTEVELLAERAPQADGGAATRGIDDRDELERGLRRLTDEQRTVIALRYYLGLTDVEVATATGLPVGTVKSRISRSLESLRAALAAEARGVAPRPSRKAGES